MSKQNGSSASVRTESIVSTFVCDDISVEKSDEFSKPRVGLGSTANENIALRRNHRELEQLWRTQKTLGEEREYVLRLIDLYTKTVQVNYRRLTKRVGRIKSHLTEAEIKEMVNDEQKKQFADKYRQILRNQTSGGGNDVIDSTKEAPSDSSRARDAGERTRCDSDLNKSLGDVCAMDVIKEEGSVAGEDGTELSGSHHQTTNTTSRAHAGTSGCGSKRLSVDSMRGHTSHNARRPSRNSNSSVPQRPETCPNPSGQNQPDSSLAMEEIIPSLEQLLDQLHNIKSQQFYENQRKLKLYDIQLLEEELESRKMELFHAVDAIINWDKKETPEEEEERKKKEEEVKPVKRQTSFMRTVLRNFSMELMMKSMQYGWTDLGQCRYLRKRGGDDDMDTSGVNTLAKDTMKIHMGSAPPADRVEPPPDGAPRPPPREPGFDENGKMIRTADLLGLKYDVDD